MNGNNCLCVANCEEANVGADDTLVSGLKMVSGPTPMSISVMGRGPAGNGK